MLNSRKASVTRRQFLAGGGALAMTTLAPTRTLSSAQKGPRLKLAIVGTGSRGSQSWGKPIVATYSDVVELVGLCDINSKRVQAAKTLMGTQAPTFLDFDRMVQETKPDVVMVTTVDSTHYRYIIRAMELGRDVITEKPMCTDEEQCQSILDTQKKTGRKVTVTFNARYGPEDMKVKELLLDKAIGDLTSVDFHEYLDTSHGADYFRRWHRLKENSGTLLVRQSLASL